MTASSAQKLVCVLSTPIASSKLISPLSAASAKTPIVPVTASSIRPATARPIRSSMSRISALISQAKSSAAVSPLPSTTPEPREFVVAETGTMRSHEGGEEAHARSSGGALRCRHSAMTSGGHATPPEKQLQPFGPANGGEIAQGRRVADDNYARVSRSMVLRSDSSSSTVVPGHAPCAERKSSDSQRAE